LIRTCSMSARAINSITPTRVIWFGSSIRTDRQISNSQVIDFENVVPHCSAALPACSPRTQCFHGGLS
jgi:hypothetical protein